MPKMRARPQVSARMPQKGMATAMTAAAPTMMNRLTVLSRPQEPVR